MRTHPHHIFSNFPTWGFHGHFVGIKYTMEGPIGRNIVCLNSLLCSSPYNNNPPYFCFPFIDGWYAYSRSHIKCGSCFFMIIIKVFSIKTFNVVNEMCNLVSTRVGPFYITSSYLYYSWFFYSWFRFLYFGCTNGMKIIRWIVCG
jgi:hypothetical protein